MTTSTQYTSLASFLKAAKGKFIYVQVPTDSFVVSVRVTKQALSAALQERKCLINASMGTEYSVTIRSISSVPVRVSEM